MGRRFDYNDKDLWHEHMNHVYMCFLFDDDVLGESLRTDQNLWSKVTPWADKGKELVEFINVRLGHRPDIVLLPSSRRMYLHGARILATKVRATTVRERHG